MYALDCFPQRMFIFTTVQRSLLRLRTRYVLRHLITIFLSWLALYPREQRVTAALIANARNARRLVPN